MDQTVANTSQHLQVLLRARLVDVRLQGTCAYYRLTILTLLSIAASLPFWRVQGLLS